MAPLCISKLSEKFLYGPLMYVISGTNRQVWSCVYLTSSGARPLVSSMLLLLMPSDWEIVLSVGPRSQPAALMEWQNYQQVLMLRWMPFNITLWEGGLVDLVTTPVAPSFFYLCHFIWSITVWRHFNVVATGGGAKQLNAHGVTQSKQWKQKT